jgi:hypothetical protein
MERPILFLMSEAPSVLEALASAIGEGATAVHFIHRYLGQLRLAPVK